MITRSPKKHFLQEVNPEMWLLWCVKPHNFRVFGQVQSSPPNTHPLPVPVRKSLFFLPSRKMHVKEAGCSGEVILFDRVKSPGVVIY